MIPFTDISYFRPIDAGVSLMGFNGSSKGDGVAFAFNAEAYLGCSEEIGVVVYDKSDNAYRIPFSFDVRQGALLGLCINHFDYKKYTYNFYADELIINDVFAHAFSNVNRFGVNTDCSLVRCKFDFDDFDWEDDRPLEIPFEDSLFYGLNVRAFTMHKTSGIHAKGTYEGLIEKIPYIKDLGVTGVVLMPTYEFDECHTAKTASVKARNMEEAQKHAFDTNDSNSFKVNCWGFIEGFYYAPKASYSLNEDCIYSFKNMVKNFHKSGIEVIMQFYFPYECSYLSIKDIFKFWAVNYHIDGFRIMGFNIPFKELICSPELKSTKLWFNYIPEDNIKNVGLFDKNKYIACDNGNFRYDCRKFLKGDEGVICDFIKYQKANPSTHMCINYLCDYDGFSLYDLYAYERKHNEENGENNFDGCDINYSWNCGIEGETRKKSILLLRQKQIKNAILILLLCQGVPYIYSGDEFANTRFGNNNAYCCDNEVGYIKWKNTVFSKEILQFFKEAVQLRKNSKIFHLKGELKGIDSKSVGFPDISYHGIEAFRPELNYNSRLIGFYLCGEYSEEQNKDSYFVGINMHWENHYIAIPKLKKNDKCIKVFDTGHSDLTSKDFEVPVAARSLVLYRIEKGKDNNEKVNRTNSKI